MNLEVTAYIERSPEDQGAILSKLRTLIFSISSEVSEQYKWSRPVYAIDKDFCYLQATKKHVTLGFFDFQKIETNAHLIEGTGKSMRHVKLKNSTQIETLKLKEMLLEVLK